VFVNNTQAAAQASRTQDSEVGSRSPSGTLPAGEIRSGFLHAVNLDMLSRMSFLDNLESSLKNLESREERDPAAGKRRDAERASALAAAPWAEKLKNSHYIQEVLQSAARIGHQTRSKIHVAWLDTILKLEIKDRRLELRPTPEGVSAVFLRGGKEERSVSVDLTASGDELVQEWLGHPGSEPGK
jgi:hypothetical protein